MKTIFWNVDTQYDFMRKEGKLYVQDAEKIEPNLQRLTDYAKQNNIQIVNTGDWHTKETKEIADEPDFMQTFPEHCMAGTKGAEYIEATKPDKPYVIDWQENKFTKDGITANRNIVIYKDAFDVFAGNEYTDRVVEILKPFQAVVYGVATNVCVNYAVLGLLNRNIDVFVPTDAIKELPGLPLDEVLKNWEKKGAVLTTVDEVVKKLR